MLGKCEIINIYANVSTKNGSVKGGVRAELDYRNL